MALSSEILHQSLCPSVMFDHCSLQILKVSSQITQTIPLTIWVNIFIQKHIHKYNNKAMEFMDGNIWHAWSWTIYCCVKGHFINMDCCIVLLTWCIFYEPAMTTTKLPLVGWLEFLNLIEWTETAVSQYELWKWNAVIYTWELLLDTFKSFCCVYCL